MTIECYFGNKGKLTVFGRPLVGVRFVLRSLEILNRCLMLLNQSYLIEMSGRRSSALIC